MNIFYKKRSGSVSIFLAMILLFTLSVVFILAEGIRQLAIKQETKIISHTSRDYLESIYQKNLWDDYGKVSWYVYQPEQADYKLLAGVVDEYLQIFQNQEEAQENIPQMC